MFIVIDLRIVRRRSRRLSRKIVQAEEFMEVTSDSFGGAKVFGRDEQCTVESGSGTGGLITPRYEDESGEQQNIEVLMVEGDVHHGIYTYIGTRNRGVYTD